MGIKWLVEDPSRTEPTRTTPTLRGGIILSQVRVGANESKADSRFGLGRPKAFLLPD